MALTKVSGGLIADNSVGLAQLDGGTDGNLITYDASGNPSHVATGSANQVLVSNGAGAAPTFQSGSYLSEVVQQVHATDATYASTTSTFPMDDTIPQITEGAEAVTVAITPTSASNFLLIEAGGLFTNSLSSTHVLLAIFQDSTADAIAVNGFGTTSGSNPNSGTVTHRMAAGTTSSTTFKLRFAGQGGTSYRNGIVANRLYGGRANSYITVTEIKA